jgi:virulence-associated protein VagC
MKTKVTEQGVLVPKKFFKGVEEVEIRQENGLVVVVPLTADPIFQLGSQPIPDEVADAAEEHDKYIYGQ